MSGNNSRPPPRPDPGYDNLPGDYFDEMLCNMNPDHPGNGPDSEEGQLGPLEAALALDPPKYSSRQTTDMNKRQRTSVTDSTNDPSTLGGLASSIGTSGTADTAGEAGAGGITGASGALARARIANIAGASDLIGSVSSTGASGAAGPSGSAGPSGTGSSGVPGPSGTAAIVGSASTVSSIGTPNTPNILDTIDAAGIADKGGTTGSVGTTGTGNAKNTPESTDVSPGPTHQTNQATKIPSKPEGNAPLEIKKMTDVKSRACDECRRRKTACYYLNSESSKCFRCQMENIECTFNSPTRTPGHSSGGRSVPIPQRSGSKQPVVAGLVGPIEDYSQLPGRSLLKKTLSLQHPRSSFAIGQHGLWDQRVLESIPLDKSNQARVSQNLALRKVGPDSWFMIRNEAGHNDWVRECDLIERTVYPYGRALVNSFFMFFHREYPILHEKIFVEKYLRTYRELMPALLGAVYLLGMRWWNHNSELTTVSRPDSIIPTLYDITLTNFFKSSGGSSLSLIQAGLLLLQCSYSDPRHLSICSVINGAAFRLALNRNCLHWKLPRWEINLRLRLSWATYTQCTWICLFDSIPPLIHDENWFLSPLNADIFDSGANEPLHNGALFIQMNKLSLIVHDMHNLLSSKLLLMYSSEISATQTMLNNANVNISVANPGLVNAGLSGFQERSPADASSTPGSQSGSPGSGIKVMNEHSAEDILELIKPIQLRLHDWYANVPSAVLNLDGESPSGNFSLRVAYIAAEVILHRFIIRVACSEHAVLGEDMTKLLRSTARERLDVAYKLIKSLKPQHLQQFWYFTSSYQFAVIGVFAALMYTTSDNKSEANYYWILLRDYINQLQIYSDNDVMGAALRTLRSSIAGVPGLVF